MPIKVVCACGGAFAARDELAGRTVACPKCKQPLKIAAPQAAQPVAAAAHANADLFDGIGLKARDTNLSRCPSCAADLIPNAVLCVKCGYNLKLGKQMQTIKMSGDSGVAVVGGGGHGADATAMLMARAAQMAEEDAIAEKTKTSVGMPVWVLITGLLACVLFGVVMSLIPQATALGGTALLILFAAGLLQLYSWVGVLVASAKRNPLYPIGIFFGDIALAITLAFISVLVARMAETDAYGGFIRIFTGAVWLTYAYMHTDECGQYITFFWLSITMQIVSAIMLVIAALIFLASRDDSGAQLPQSMPALEAFVSASPMDLPRAILIAA